MIKTIIMAAVVMIVISPINVCIAQSGGATRQRLNDIEQKLSRVDQKLSQQERTLADLKEDAGIGFIVLFLFGLVLSMWAMNRQGSGCAWFILGFIPGVNIIAGLFALFVESKNQSSGKQQE